MHSLVLALLLLQLPIAPVQVPDLPSPTRESLPNTPSELAVLHAGDALYDQGKFDDAMSRYNEVLKSNPNNVSAMHQLADTLFQKREYQKAVDLAIKGLEFKSSIRPLFYVLIGNTLDSTGQPQRAVDVYRSGLAIAPASGILYYNLGVTLNSSLKDAAQGRTVFKQGALADPSYPGIQFQLAVSFAMDDLKTPALLAISRYLVLDPTSNRAATGYNLWRQMLNGNAVRRIKTVRSRSL